MGAASAPPMVASPPAGLAVGVAGERMAQQGGLMVVKTWVVMINEPLRVVSTWLTKVRWLTIIGS